LVQSTSVTELDSCCWALNKFAAPNTTVKAADCMSAAANCHGCCYRTACCRWSAAEARKSVRRSNSSDDCRCSSASKDVRAGRWRLQTASCHVPRADDWHRSCACFARVGSPGDWSFRNLQARDHDP
jgi:hypothetical protein